MKGRSELGRSPSSAHVVSAMWHGGAPHQGQCGGCTTTAWHVKDAVYLNARGVSYAVLARPRWRPSAGTTTTTDAHSSRASARPAPLRPAGGEHRRPLRLRLCVRAHQRLHRICPARMEAP
ncbi:MAG: hypothetical protein QOD04_584 [Pseudonocardiales bacterium]|nr:hypothetical protein [Pseudonocardiales bacterium]MDT7661028.1 hypothetical protein [Pseudonocardiales bacterium]